MTSINIICVHEERAIFQGKINVASFIYSWKWKNALLNVNTLYALKIECLYTVTLKDELVVSMKSIEVKNIKRETTDTTHLSFFGYVQLVNGSTNSTLFFSVTVPRQEISVWEFKIKLYK